MTFKELPNGMIVGSPLIDWTVLLRHDVDRTPMNASYLIIKRDGGFYTSSAIYHETLSLAKTACIQLHAARLAAE